MFLLETSQKKKKKKRDNENKMGEFWQKYYRNKRPVLFVLTYICSIAHDF